MSRQGFVVATFVAVTVGLYVIAGWAIYWVVAGLL